MAYFDLDEPEHIILRKDVLGVYQSALGLNDSDLDVAEKVSTSAFLETESNKKRLLNNYSKAIEIFSNYNLIPPDLVSFTGPGFLDGHGLSLNHSAICFVDFSLLNGHYQQVGFEPLTHLIHEMIHAVHYTLNPEFSFPCVFKKSRAGFLNKLIAEGISLAISERILGGQYDIFWFGFIERRLVNQWGKLCDKKFKADLNIIKSDEYSDRLDMDFFSIESFSIEHLLMGRRGYYIGYKVALSILDSYPISYLLNLSYKDWLCIIDGHLSI